MDKSLLVRIIGFPATLIHGDTLVLDRWLWLRRRLPITANGETLIDIGCGTGAFTIGAAKRGYCAVGLSWDERNQSEANIRARSCGVKTTFEVCDVRELDKYKKHDNKYDVAICAENIEHIIDDKKLVIDIANCLRPGGRLLLTTPNFYYRAITSDDNGPFETRETGWHVRRGYTRSMLHELCQIAGLLCEEISFCSGFFSQKVTRLMRLGSRAHPLIGWIMVLPFRPVVPILDRIVARWVSWPHFSICMEAQKPRFSPSLALTDSPAAHASPRH
jgi:SAM-dependent methyltransferase